MKRKLCNVCPRGEMRKYALKLCLLLLLIPFISNGKAYAMMQNNVIRLTMKNASLQEVIWELEKSSEFIFAYNAEELKAVGEINVNISGETVQDALASCLQGTGLTYVVEQNVIVIRKMEQTDQLPQEKKVITGRVVDSNNQPIPGVTVRLKGTNIGVFTDDKGNYSLKADFPADAVIQFSFIGMKLEEVAVDGQSQISLTLKPDTQDVSEVVVTGAFTRKANTYTGAVTTVKRDELLKMSTQNVLSGLANIDPSFVKVDNLAAGSDPNATATYQMRGTSSISQNFQSQYENDPNQPLFILDGFETTIEKVKDLDINMIESITLLKDATAKAIYGSKGANGVVVVETRRPEGGKLRVTYNGGLSLEMPDLTSYDLANAAEKLEVERLAGLYSSDNYVTQLSLNKTYNNKMLEVLRGVDTDWLAQPVRTGVGQKHSVYIDGGDDVMLYGVDLFYNNVAGAMKGSDRETFAGGITLTYRKKNILFRNRLAVTYNESNNSPYGTFSQYALMNPYSRLYDENGNMVQSYNYNGTLEANPIWNTTINTTDRSTYTDISNNFYGEWTVRQGLKVVGRLGVSAKESRTDLFKPASHTDFLNYTDVLKKGSYVQSNGRTHYINGDMGVNYSFVKGKHLLFTNGQVNFASNSYDRVAYSAEGFPNDYMDHIIFAVQYAEGGKPTGTEGISHTAGALLSANYSFDERYLFDANYRLSGSSEYGSNKRWGTFWSLGAGWNMHKETFLADSPFISLLKLRFSVGYTGSQGFNTYEALSTLRYYTNTSYYGNIGSYLVSLANPDLKWQSKYDKSVGLDFALAHNRISGRFDYYVANTEDMLTDVTLPPSTGFGYYRANLGKTENKGIEANLNVRAYQSKTSRDFLNLYVSVAHNKNKLKEISNSLKAFNDTQDETKSEAETSTNYDDITTPSVRYVEGQSINTIWAVQSLGIDPQNGQEIFVKKDGTTTYEWDANDQIAAGDAMPNVTGNLGISGEFKNIGCNISFYYRLGGQIYNSTLVDKVENADVAYNVDRRVFTDRWQQEGDLARFKAITDKSYTRPTTRFVEDNNTLTLSSVNVYYDFRETSLVQKSFLQQLRLSVNLNDIFVISSVKTERGTSYPFARNATFTIQATF
ncbi:SusC/RagA family TonB-linked outer membrane protein [Mangrovibacterium marinum]|uniref:TonB-linked SusC/RagA family outer membrane protein n=1 Tax=Mangrovibacterium marinum TaxID=1639118 RepID=A0A2T5BXR7_9BACT|nr:SusC/RagA family TonB-linked outer membrane protein [Mangrovibacterium marinum]PTN05929.1 TonB-linked SusC/RagA family outer membrane protein [Mangrovibacterium marinum]